MERNEKLTGNARSLRKQMTKEEVHLWYQFLCRYKPRFHRQYVIGNYIADYCCHKAKIVVELDGSQHYDPRKKRSRSEKNRIPALTRPGSAAFQQFGRNAAISACL